LKCKNKTKLGAWQVGLNNINDKTKDHKLCIKPLLSKEIDKLDITIENYHMLSLPLNPKPYSMLISHF
jgi:hypothetical protein